MTNNFIKGSGGGGGGGKGGGGGSRTPTTAKDSLNNRSFANILDVISEGEIDGIHDPGGFTNSFHQSIFFNNTPLKNADGTDNFNDVKIDVRNGTPIQNVIKGFNKSSSPVPVSLEITKNTPVTFTITDTSVTSVIIDIGIPALQKVNKDGDTQGTEVIFKFLKSQNNSSFQNISINGTVDQKITGRTGDLYQRQYEFNIEGNNFPVQFQVQRISDDDSTINNNNSDNLINHSSAIQLRSYQLIKDFDNPIQGTFSQSGTTITVNTTEPHTKVLGDSLGFEFLNDGIHQQFTFNGNNQIRNNSYTGASNGNFQVTSIISSTSFTVEHTESKNVVNGTCKFYRVLNYPNSALVGIKLDAEQFNSIPRRAFLINGIKVKIPAGNELERLLLYETLHKLPV